MKGIGKKVTVAFLSVVALLAVSGFISLSELSTLSYDTDEILAASSRDVEIAKDMLDAAHDHSRAMLDVAVFDNSDGLSVCDEALSKISSHITAVYARSSREVQGCLDTLVNYGARLENLVNEQKELLGVVVKAEEAAVPTNVESADSAKVQKSDAAVADLTNMKPILLLHKSADDNFVPSQAEISRVKAKRKSGRRWYVENYEPAYNCFVSQVKRYIDLSHSELAPRAELLSKNAYRSVTPILISLAVMISIVLMLYYFIYIYGVKPIRQMNRSLADFLTFRLPYKAKVEMVDEMKELSDNIEHLVNSSKLDVKQKRNAI